MPIYTNAVHVGRVRRGTATVMAMLFLAIFVALAVALASTLTASVSLTQNQVKAVRAQAAADSGMEYYKSLISRVSLTGTVPTDSAALLHAIYGGLTTYWAAVPCTEVKDNTNTVIRLDFSQTTVLGTDVKFNGKLTTTSVTDANGKSALQLVLAVTGTDAQGGQSRTVQSRFSASTLGGGGNFSIFDYGIAAGGLITMGKDGAGRDDAALVQCHCSPNGAQGNGKNWCDGCALCKSLIVDQRNVSLLSLKDPSTGTAIDFKFADIQGYLYARSQDAVKNTAKGNNLVGFPMAKPNGQNKDYIKDIPQGVTMPQFDVTTTSTTSKAIMAQLDARKGYVLGTDTDVKNQTSTGRQYARYDQGATLNGVVVVPANTNWNLSNGLVINGPLYIQQPNNIQLGQMTVNGPIIFEQAPTGSTTTSSLKLYNQFQQGPLDASKVTSDVLAQVQGYGILAPSVDVAITPDINPNLYGSVVGKSVSVTFRQDEGKDLSIHNGSILSLGDALVQGTVRMIRDANYVRPSGGVSGTYGNQKTQFQLAPWYYRESMGN